MHITLEELSKTAAEEIGARDADIEKRDTEIASLREDIATKEHAMQVSVQSIEVWLNNDSVVCNIYRN